MPVARHCYDYPRPGLATDVAIFTVNEGRLKVLLIQRLAEPCRGRWALPGGFLHPGEDLDACARRELMEEAGVDARALRHFANFSAPDRDSRWVVSAAYLALLAHEDLSPRAGSDAGRVDWFEVRDPMDVELAFDHKDILMRAHETLRESAHDWDVLLALVPNRFTLTELQIVHDAIEGHEPTTRDSRKAHFRKAVKASGRILETGEQTSGVGRPAGIWVRRG